MKPFHVLLAGAMLALLQACGGGSSSTTAVPPGSGSPVASFPVGEVWNTLATQGGVFAAENQSGGTTTTAVISYVPGQAGSFTRQGQYTPAENMGKFDLSGLSSSMQIAYDTGVDYAVSRITLGDGKLIKPHVHFWADHLPRVATVGAYGRLLMAEPDSSYDSHRPNDSYTMDWFLVRVNNTTAKLCFDWQAEVGAVIAGSVDIRRVTDCFLIDAQGAISGFDTSLVNISATDPSMSMTFRQSGTGTYPDAPIANVPVRKVWDTLASRGGVFTAENRDGGATTTATISYIPGTSGRFTRKGQYTPKENVVRFDVTGLSSSMQAVYDMSAFYPVSQITMNDGTTVMPDPEWSSFYTVGALPLAANLDNRGRIFSGLFNVQYNNGFRTGEIVTVGWELISAFHPTVAWVCFTWRHEKVLGSGDVIDCFLVDASGAILNFKTSLARYIILGRSPQTITLGQSATMVH